MMSFKYELLKRIVKLSGFKNSMFTGDVDDLLARAKTRNAKNTIPNLKDDELETGRIEVDGFPVLTMLHKPRAKRQCWRWTSWTWPFPRST